MTGFLLDTNVPPELTRVQSNPDVEDWLDCARDKWRSGKEASERDGAVEMDDAQFSAFLDESLTDAARQ